MLLNSESLAVHQTKVHGREVAPQRRERAPPVAPVLADRLPRHLDGERGQAAPQPNGAEREASRTQLAEREAELGGMREQLADKAGKLEERKAQLLRTAGIGAQLADLQQLLGEVGAGVNAD